MFIAYVRMSSSNLLLINLRQLIAAMLVLGQVPLYAVQSHCNSPLISVTTQLNVEMDDVGTPVNPVILQ